MASPGQGGGTGGDGAGNHCLRRPALPGHLLQVQGVCPCGRGTKLACSGAQPQACQAEVGAADSGIKHGGSGCPYIGTYLLGCGKIGPAIRVRDMGPDIAYAEGVRRFPPKGGLQTDGTETTEGAGQRLGLPPTRGCVGGGGFAGGGDLRLPPPEHGGAIYCD